VNLGILDPEGVFHPGVQVADVDEIIESHMVRNQPVERLRIPDAVLNTTHKTSD